MTQSGFFLIKYVYFNILTSVTLCIQINSDYKNKGSLTYWTSMWYLFKCLIIIWGKSLIPMYRYGHVSILIGHKMVLQHTCTSLLVKCVQFLVVVPLQVHAGSYPLFRATASSVVVSTSLFVKSHSSLDRSTFVAAANGTLQNWQGSIVQLIFV